MKTSFNIDFYRTHWEKQLNDIPMGRLDKLSAFAKNLFKDVAFLSGIGAAGYLLATRVVTPAFLGLSALTVSLAALSSLFKDRKQEDKKLIKKGMDIAIDIYTYTRSYVELKEKLKNLPEVKQLFSGSVVLNELFRKYMADSRKYTETRDGLLVDHKFEFEFDDTNKQKLVEKINKQIRLENFPILAADHGLGIKSQLQNMGADLELVRQKAYKGSDISGYDEDVVKILQKAILEQCFDAKYSIAEAMKQEAVIKLNISKQQMVNFYLEKVYVSPEEDWLPFIDKTLLVKRFLALDFKQMNQYKADAQKIGVDNIEELLQERFNSDMLKITNFSQIPPGSDQYLAVFANAHKAHMHKIVIGDLVTKSYLLDANDPVCAYLTPEMKAVIEKACESHKKELESYEKNIAKVEKIRGEHLDVLPYTQGLEDALEVTRANIKNLSHNPIKQKEEEEQAELLEKQIKKMKAATAEINQKARDNLNKRCDEQLAFWKTWFEGNTQNIQYSYQAELRKLKP